MIPLANPKLLSDDFDFQGSLPSWRVSADGKELSQEFIFQDFKSAFEFMTLAARYAEEIDHHPDWSNAWNRVSVRLSTHSMRGLTELDLAMAKAMDQFAKQVRQ
jgi:4a-hydroxytetrahydrobiopterin dehydratase